MRPLTGTEAKRLNREWRRRTEGRVALLLDVVQQPYNVGSILRSAAAFGVDHLWLVGATQSPRHPKTQKTALGCDRYLTWTHVETPAAAAAAVHGEGYRLVGLELAEGAVPIHELVVTGPICLAVGHEDRGLSKTTLAACDTVTYLPQPGPVGSLNVAVATAIALYELRRIGWAQDPPGSC